MLTEWLIEFKQRDKRRLTFGELRQLRDRWEALNAEMVDRLWR